jgi:uncharacterized protein
MLKIQKIVLDSNFLMIPGQFGVDIFEALRNKLNFPYKLFIVKNTIAELNKIIEKAKNRDKIAARIGLELIKTKSINIIDCDESAIVDDELVMLSNDGCIIATQDKELKSRIANKKIVLRQKKYIELVR